MKEKGQYLKGLIGEKKAEKLLKREGYRVLARRFRAAGGEIDLICRERDVIVFVEVKYRPDGNRGDGIMAVTPDKIRRITGAGQVYLMRYPDAPARIDLVEITRDGADHIRNIY